MRFRPKRSTSGPATFSLPCAIRTHLEHLQNTLEKTDTRRQDIVVVTVKIVTQAASGEHGLEADQMFADQENVVFSRVVGLAEKAGKHVELLTVPGTDPWLAIVQTAAVLKSARLVTGLSPNLTPAEQGRRVGVAWEELPQPRPSLSLEVVMPDPNESMYFNLGPHPPEALARGCGSDARALARSDRPRRRG